MEHVSIIDKNGFCISRTELMNENGDLITYELKEDEQVVEKITNVELVKPKWVFDKEEWVEGATREEIKEQEEKNKPKPKEPNEDEILMSNILLENATLKQKTSDLEEMTANVMLQIAELKGGNINA
ncbi:hypothetical protein DVV81_10035 [Clostridium botulinum]|uniref:hypothetical protein n=1 Tax=Clostridium botulinum TaxID=1491 RepID=UPI0019670CDF|nr:hypothetical protein [Clostridium botulinum]MBN1071502.1 hypothetical protein [Clostridium botulinum]